MADDSSNTATAAPTSAASSASGGISHHQQNHQHHNVNVANQHPPSPFHSPSTNRNVISASAMAAAAAASSSSSSSPRPTYPSSIPPPVTVSPAIGSVGGNAIINGRERSRSFGHNRSSPGTPGGRRSLPTSPLQRQLHANQHTGGPMPPPFMPNMSSSNNNIIPPSSPTIHRATADVDHALSLEHRKQTAIRHALENERSRVSRLESLEEHMTVEALKKALKRERQHSARLASDLAALKVENVEGQAEAEISEEGRINGLMRRLECLQKEKGRIIVELEREEEMLTNTLQKKLNEVRREKMLLERQIEQEHIEHAQLLQSNNISGVAAGGGGNGFAVGSGSNNNNTNDGAIKQQAEQQIQQIDSSPQQNHTLPNIEIKEEDEEEDEEEGSDCGEQVILEDLAGIQQDRDSDDDENMGV